MLIDCPECARPVSDRANACPQCAFPVAEHQQQQAQQAQADADRLSRAVRGTTDCPACDARGFIVETEGFRWCGECAHSGRVTLVCSQRGYWAVAHAQLDAFIAGTASESRGGVTFLGEQVPPPRYPGGTDPKAG